MRLRVADIQARVEERAGRLRTLETPERFPSFQEEAQP
jgi:hypothetical protein